MENNFHIIWYDILDSTNDEALRHIGSIDNLSVIAARLQTAGRGQRGNKWLSGQSDSLTFSVVLKFGKGLPALPGRDSMSLNKWSALAVCRLLAGLGIKAMIKWPNDIYVGNRTICGILVENAFSGDQVGYTVMGIGLNLNQVEFPDSLPNPVSAYQLIHRRTLPDNALRQFVYIMEKSLDTLFDKPSLDALYLERLYHLDKPSRWRDPVDGKEFTGTIKGVLEDGRLMLEVNGEVKTFGFKEIEYILEKP